MTTPAPMAEDVQLPTIGILQAGGRYFMSLAKTTARQDTYIMSLLNEAGLEQLRDQFTGDGDLTDGAIDLLKAAYEKDLLYEILGGLLTETDAQGTPLPLFDKRGRLQRWTVEKAQEIADLIANLDDPHEKEQFHELMNAVLILFFTTGVSPLLNSQSFSAKTPAPQDLPETPTSSETPRPAGSSTESADELLRKVLATGTVDPSITASGIAPSEK
jgi:hypothetical protein